MIKILNVILPLDYTDEDIKNSAAQKLNISTEDIISAVIARRSTIKKDKSNIHFKAAVNVTVKSSLDQKRICHISRSKEVSIAEEEKYVIPSVKLMQRPVIIGFGPAGIFAALVLAEAGARPIILERGSKIDQRKKDIFTFETTSALNTESNIQFGEGGAGAYSDAKLKAGFVDARKRKILSEFVAAGAAESILYLEKAHIGSDRLHTVVKNLREKIISLGGEFHFNSKLTRLLKRDGKIIGAEYASNGTYTQIDTDNIILAIGHSARDTMEYLYNDGVLMVQKGFGVGVRIEHPQELIDRLEFGTAAGNKVLGSADYKLVTHLKGGRSVYTFCMCPGGYVVAAASEENQICTNGMSEYARAEKNANTAMLVSVTPDDFGSENALAGIDYQRQIERKGFLSGGGKYFAPTMRMEDFINGTKTTAFGDVLPSYRPGTSFAPLSEYLPQYITDALSEGLKDMFEWMKGYYYPDALLTGPETRTTSPIRILRTDKYEAVNISGLYPCGEGAGYAGGIISAAVDGMICAETIIKKNSFV